MQSALDGLNETAMPPEWRDNDRIVLQNNISFWTIVWRRAPSRLPALQAFAKKQAPHLKLDVEWEPRSPIG
jgi:hypothetical protein